MSQLGSKSQLPENPSIARGMAHSCLPDLGAHLLALDVTSKQSCQDAVAKVLAEQNRIDILINK